MTTFFDANLYHAYLPFHIENEMLVNPVSTTNRLNNINSVLNSNAPFKRVKKYKLRFKTKPWITPALQKSISVKNSLLNKIIKSKDPQTKEHHHLKYKTYRNMLSTLMKKSKMNYYNHYFKNNWDNIKSTWKSIKSILNINNTQSNILKILVSNNTTSAEPIEIANIFDNFFTSVAAKTKESIKYSHKHFSNFLKNRSDDSFFLSPTDKYEIINIISSLDPTKSTGLNSIPTKILKLLKNDISTQLSDIFNVSFSTGIFPTILKIAKVVPVHKKQSKLAYSNYCPISLLSNLEKILEKLMYSRIFKFLNDSNSIYPLQFGFRQKYSTTHALISLTEDIRKNLGKGNIGCGIFVDLQKAFDTVEHDILLAKLEHDIRGLANEWFRSYLSNRKQYVSINGHESSLASVLYGVPEGSVLGPLLFLIYINDLNQAIKFCKVHHFADGTNLLHFNKSVAKLNKLVNLDMKNLTVWLNANKISLNVDKTELVIFKHQRKKLDTEIKIKLNRKRLYPSQSVRYRGIKIDQNLNWEDHINDIAVKLNRANALLFKIRNFVNVTILKTIYFAIFDSHINYANLVWAQNSNAMSRILTLQKKALRIITFQSRNCHSGPLFFKLKLLKFNDKVHLENVLLVSKFINSLLPPVFNNWFTFCSNVHNYETTSSATCKLFKPSFRTNLYGKNSITVNAIDAWNKAQTSLADTILRDLTPNKIKTIMKKMIDSY